MIRLCPYVYCSKRRLIGHKEALTALIHNPPEGGVNPPVDGGW